MKYEYQENNQKGIHEMTQAILLTSLLIGLLIIALLTWLAGRETRGNRRLTQEELIVKLLLKQAREQEKKSSWA